MQNVDCSGQKPSQITNWLLSALQREILNGDNAKKNDE